MCFGCENLLISGRAAARSSSPQATAHGDWAVLRANDQLFKEQMAGRVFSGFTEGPIDFPPTFKVNFCVNVNAN